MFKLLILSSALAIVKAGFLTGQHSVEIIPPSGASQSSNILRSPGNVAQVSSYSKTVETPYSSQTKTDVRINNPDVYTHNGPVIYSNSLRVPATGFARGDVAQFSSGPTVAHVTYNTGPVAYATAPTLGRDVTSYGPSYSDHAIGSTRENTVQSLDGNHAVTHYSKAVDTAFSSVRKSDTRVTNDAKLVSVSPTVAYATAAAYASPIVAKINPTGSYSSAPVVAHATFSGLGTQYNW